MRTKFKFALALFTCLTMALAGCSNDEPDDKSSKPGESYGKLNGKLITTGSTRDVTYTGCILLGTVDFPKITSDHTYGIVYMEAVTTPDFDYDTKLIVGGRNDRTDKEEYTCIQSAITSSTAEGKFEKQLIKLKPNTRYYYRAYVSIGRNTNYSSVEYFTTLDPTPEISMATADATDIFAVKGKMNGTVRVGNLQDNNEDQTYGFIYSSDQRLSTAGNLTYEYYKSWEMNHFETEDDMEEPDEVTTNDNFNGRINADVIHLKPGTTYYYRSFFKWNDKYFYSPEVKTLTTLGTNEITVGTGIATEVTDTEATLNATLPFSRIGLDDVQGGFMISKKYYNASEFNIEEATPWSNHYSYPDEDVYYVSTYVSDKDFSCRIEGLDPETTYYVCGYISLGRYDNDENDDDESVEMWVPGSIQSFRTEAGSISDDNDITIEATGSYPWTRSNGVWYSSNMGIPNSTSSLTISVRHQLGDRLCVHLNVSSESGYDGVKIYNTSDNPIPAEGLFGLLSGTISDTYYIPLNSGTYVNGKYESVITIEYLKDSSSDVNADRAWIEEDMITIVK